MDSFRAVTVVKDTVHIERYRADKLRRSRMYTPRRYWRTLLANMVHVNQIRHGWFVRPYLAAGLAGWVLEIRIEEV